MVLVFSRALGSWFLTKAKASKLAVLVTAVVVMVPGMILRQKVSEALADSYDQRPVRSPAIPDDDAFLESPGPSDDQNIDLNVGILSTGDGGVNSHLDSSIYNSNRDPLNPRSLTKSSIESKNLSEGSGDLNNVEHDSGDSNHVSYTEIKKDGDGGESPEPEKREKSEVRTLISKHKILLNRTLTFKTEPHVSPEGHPKDNKDTDKLDYVKSTRGQDSGVVQRYGVGCRGVLKRSTEGRWVPRPYSSDELKLIQRFLNNTRGKMGLPPSLQRPDMKCGNVSFGDYKFGDRITYKWFRALCNPFGKTPCCKDNQCVSRDKEQCRCEGCMDLRQQIHAELSTWVPDDQACKLRQYNTREQACTALNDFTIHFMGDSLLRQIFVAFLHFLKVPDPEVKAKDEYCRCQGYYSYLSYCARYLPFSVKTCGDKVTVKRSFNKRSYEAPDIIKQVLRYEGQPNSLVVIGMGMHDHLNRRLIRKTLIKPLISALLNSTWPRIVWVTYHAPGLLKSPWLSAQLAPSILHYNNGIRAAFYRSGIPVMDTFGLTKDGVMTYDGLHYGEGVNMLKAQILMNYVQEIRQQNRGHER